MAVGLHGVGRRRVGRCCRRSPKPAKYSSSGSCLIVPGIMPTMAVGRAVPGAERGGVGERWEGQRARLAGFKADCVVFCGAQQTARRSKGANLFC